MQITYDSNKNCGLHLTLSKDEIKDQANSITKAMLFVSQFVVDLASQISDDADERDGIIEIILNNSLDFSKDFYKKAEENEMYSYMEEIYEETFLTKLHCSEQQFKKRHKKNAAPIRIVFNIDTDSDIINIGFSHSEEIDDLIVSFPISIIQEDEDQFQRNCDIVHIIRTVAGDRIYGKTNNPFRRCSNEFDGTANFGLAKTIKDAIEKN